MAEIEDAIEAEVIEEGAIILSPFKELDLTEGVDLDELLKTYAVVPEIDPEAENAGELYQEVLAGHKAFVKARNKIEKVRKELKAPALEFGKLVDTKAKALASKIHAKELELFTQRDKVEKNEQRKQDEYERAERDRLIGIQNFIESIKNLPMLAIGTKSTTIEDIMGQSTKPTEETCGERLDEAMVEWDKASQMLNTMLVQAQAVEQAEEVTRKAKEEAEAKEAEQLKSLEEEKDAFAKEKAEWKAQKDAEAEAEAMKRAEQAEEDALAKEMAEAKRIAEHVDDVRAGVKNDIQSAYDAGGIQEVIIAIIDNKIDNLRWSV